MSTASTATLSAAVKAIERSLSDRNVIIEADPRENLISVRDAVHCGWGESLAGALKEFAGLKVGAEVSS